MVCIYHASLFTVLVYTLCMVDILVSEYIAILTVTWHIVHMASNHTPKITEVNCMLILVSWPDHTGGVVWARY